MTAAAASDANVVNADAATTAIATPLTPPTTTHQRPLRELGIGFARVHFPDDRGSDQSRGDARARPFIVSRAKWMKADRDGLADLARKSLRSGSQRGHSATLRRLGGGLVLTPASLRSGPPRGHSAALRRLGGG